MMNAYRPPPLMSGPICIPNPSCLVMGPVTICAPGSIGVVGAIGVDGVEGVEIFRVPCVAMANAQVALPANLEMTYEAVSAA